MAKSILDIVFKLSKQGGADTETVKGLIKVKSAILDAAAMGGALVAAGYTVKKMFDESVGTLINYADQVRNVQNATGASAEDASKLIQILDDQKISYEQLEKAIAKSGKAYDFSIEGLAKMSDQYLQLEGAQEQATFMQERFGKQWISFVPVMKQGGQAIRDAADAVSDSLVLTQNAIDQARQYEIEVDNLTDQWEAFKIEIGTGVLPIVTKLLHTFNQAADIREEADRLMEEGIATSRREAMAIAAINVKHAEWLSAAYKSTDALDANTDAAQENAEAIKEISRAHTDMLGLIGKVASQEQSYQETATQLAEERVKIEQERAAAIQAGWWEGSEKIRDFDAALEENSLKAEENANKHHEAMGRIQYDLFITKLSVDGITDAEFLMAQEAGLMFGVFDQASVTTAKNMDTVAQAVADGTIKVQDMKRVLDALNKGYSIDVVLNVLTNIAATAASKAAHIKADKNKDPNRSYSGYAEGGISMGPQSGHWELLHGTEAVIPLQNGSVPVQMSGSSSSAAGGSPVYVTITIASPVTIMDEQNAQNTLTPYIINGIRQAKARGAI